jgi:hypothetical protein
MYGEGSPCSHKNASADTICPQRAHRVLYNDFICGSIRSSALYDAANSDNADLRSSIFGGVDAISSKNLATGLLAVTKSLYPARAASTIDRGEAPNGSKIHDPLGIFLDNQVEMTPSGICGRYRDNGSGFFIASPGIYTIDPNMLWSIDDSISSSLKIARD